MRHTIRKQFAFSASHRLSGLRDGHPCGRLHGHNYVVEVELSSDALGPHGFVLDYGDLAPFGAWIDSNLDHQHLNDVLPDMQPSAELLAIHLLSVLRSTVPIPAGVSIGVGVSETPKTWAWVWPR
jgi:6-pyruvoyltetrahydropterin/6-carboxytetrahydropterin synthase